MKKKRIGILVILIVVIIAVIQLWQNPSPNEEFVRTPARLKYTKHALCRMDCRFISKEDIQEVLQKGSINFNKSRRKNGECPTYALQGRTSDGQYIRVIFAQCNNETRVVTTYDLEQDYVCHCPGDAPSKK